ncbi:hypothetical protein [Spongiactinospora sp. TRM90649]|uniref:hypothetical protein n=1 Tax=Spongiactinospora sp. TRM90649 TaxID=3031114 RepID=UPI0023F6BAB0|nr:hypothetical protein [Spongiactinospora sp. TRM90649]MDF5752960.1 hypothetical protein [Spongiactinospora sp. TRM90649]
MLRPDEARMLLVSVADSERVAAEPVAATRLVAGCGFLPLTVRIAAALLAARPSRSIGTLAARLDG